MFYHKYRLKHHKEPFGKGSLHTMFYHKYRLKRTLVKNPLYDSTRYCKRMHPEYTSRPIDSWRMTFMDFGNTGGEANVQMLKEKDTYRYGYLPGTVGPMGPIKGGAVNSLKAACTWFTEGTMGVWIKDPTKGGELILDFER